MDPRHPKCHNKFRVNKSIPPWSQHSSTSGGYFPLLCACGQPHHNIFIEQHHNRKAQQHTRHFQIGYSYNQLFHHLFRGQNKISRKWNGPPHKQWGLLPIRTWIQEQSGRISLAQHKISGSQQGPLNNTPLYVPVHSEWTTLHNVLDSMIEA